MWGDEVSGPEVGGRGFSIGYCCERVIYEEFYRALGGLRLELLLLRAGGQGLPAVQC